MAAEVSANGSSFQVGRVQPLFGGMPQLGDIYREYDVATDGQRFLVAMQTEQPAPEPLILVQNWTAGLKR